MPTGVLVPYDATGATRLDVRYTNGTGSLITTTPTLDGDGREIADEYLLTVSAAVPATTCTITVTTTSTKGPYHNKVFAGVVCDNATVRDDIVPGVNLVFSNSGSLANGWTTTIYVGVYAGLLTAGNPAGTQLSWATGIGTPGVGSVAAGQPGFIGKFTIVNTGAEAVANAVAVFRPRAKDVLKSGARAFNYIQVINNTPFEDVSVSGQIEPIIMTFANLDTAATPDEIDVLMNENGGGAATFNVQEVDTGTPLTSTQLKMDASTRYQVTASGSRLEGLIFTLATTATNSSIENILVFNKRHTWIAPDVAGSPGTYTQSSVTLTQSGQPSGVINAAGTCPLWVKLDVLGSASNKQNPFPGDIQCEYALTGEAAWTA